MAIARRLRHTEAHTPGGTCHPLQDLSGATGILGSDSIWCQLCRYYGCNHALHDWPSGFLERGKDNPAGSDTVGREICPLCSVSSHPSLSDNCHHAPEIVRVPPC